MEEKNIKYLQLSSCDETAAAVVENGRKVLVKMHPTQIIIHTLLRCCSRNCLKKASRAY